MSHPALATIADWMSDETSSSGINTLLTSVPLYSDDVLPDTPPAVYDEWRDDWVASGVVPDSDDSLGGITSPLVALTMTRNEFTEGPFQFDATNMGLNSTLRFGVLIGVRGPLTAALGRSCFYLSRVVLNSLEALSQGTDTERTVTGTGIQLRRMQSIARGGLSKPIKDITGVTGWDVVFALTESTALTF